MEFNNIYLLKGIFNYFNRKIYFYESLEDYLYLAEDYEVKTEVNFNPNEGVNTSLIVSLDSAVNYFEYCYLLVTDKDGNIISRWYIKDATRNLSGQFTLTLRRDVVAESIASGDFIRNAPVYVEKAILNETDPLIVNDEGVRFNQIKKSEDLIRDKIKVSGWLIGYYKTGTTKTIHIASRGYTPPESTSLSDIATATGINESDLTDMINNPKYFATSNFKLTYGLYTGILQNCFKIDNFIAQDFNTYIAPHEETAFAWTGALAGYVDSTSVSFWAAKLAQYFIDHNTNLRNELQTVIQNEYASERLYINSQLQALQNYQNQIVNYGGAYYRLRVYITDNSAHPEITITKGESVYFDTAVNTVSTEMHTTVYDDWNMFLNYTVASVRIALDPLPLGAYQLTIPASANSLIDAPFSMFAIPLNGIVMNIPRGGGTYEGIFPEIVDESALDVVNRITTELGADLYDVQILPYFPEPERFFPRYQYGKSFIYLDEITENVDFTYITAEGDTTDIKGIILYPARSKFSLTLDKALTMKRDSLKIESQTDFYRIVSPNYNGIFEFNLAKNGGSVSCFLVDCTYKPFNPFIRVSPQFNFLYGTNFEDGRGLICGGEFSLAIIKDAWVNYELMNKNYSMAFSRDIVNLDVSQRQERFKEPFTLAAGAIGSGAAGALGGFKIGGVYGAAAGAAIGLTAGAAGGALDAKLNEERRAETKDYAIDRFNLSLGNIKAMPQSLARTAVLTNIFKVFPFIEYYTCTDEEVAALESKIEYDGMTVGRIGNIFEFMGGNKDQKYFKGQLIRALGIFDNEDFIEALYNELAKGVYI